MSKLKETISDSKYLRFCIYVASAAVLLYALYFIIRNMDTILPAITGFLSNILAALSPLFIGLILSYLLAPLVDIIDKKLMGKILFKMPKDPIKLERRMKLRRTLSVVLTFLLLIFLICAIIYAFAILIVGQVVFDGIGATIERVRGYFLEYETSVRSWAASLPAAGLEDKIQDIINSVVNWFSKSFSVSSIIGFVSSLGGSVLNVFLGIVVAIYLLKDRDFFLRLWRKFLHVCLPMGLAAKVTGVLSDVDKVLSQFLRGQLLDALIVAVLSSIALSVMGLQFAIFIGCFAGIANIIPYFGPIIGMIPAFIVGLITGGFPHALLAVVLLFIIQQIDGNFIYPKVVGSNTGLHPLFILIAVTFGGHFWGIVGMLLAVPTTAIIKLFIVRKLGSLDSGT